MRAEGEGDGENAARDKPAGAPRYDWPSLAIFAIFLGAFIYALSRR
ncbi:hypothetical protein [Methylocystis parvus]|nr:hypothetical protein [Methylocystis parvus]WBK00108.1 hypothetical protein MMG94_19405 [Methylocystis parvus OBBP]